MEETCYLLSFHNKVDSLYFTSLPIWGGADKEPLTGEDGKAYSHGCIYKYLTDVMWLWFTDTVIFGIPQMVTVRTNTRRCTGTSWRPGLPLSWLLRSVSIDAKHCNFKCLSLGKMKCTMVWPFCLFNDVAKSEQNCYGLSNWIRSMQSII
jgi:hypothetical protein